MGEKDVGKRLRGKQPAGRALTFTYNADSRISQITDPAGTTVDFTYDANGNLATVKDVKGGITNYTYVAQGLATICSESRCLAVTSSLPNSVNNHVSNYRQ